MSTRYPIDVFEDDDDQDYAPRLPTRFEVCGTCEGRGTTRAHVEADGGGFTGSEWAELDDDFREGYLAGDYDRPCGECKGKRVVSVVDEDRCTTPELEAALAVHRENAAIDAEIAAERAAERRMRC